MNPQTVTAIWLLHSAGNDNPQYATTLASRTGLSLVTHTHPRKFLQALLAAVIAGARPLVVLDSQLPDPGLLAIATVIHDEVLLSAQDVIVLDNGLSDTGKEELSLLGIDTILPALSEDLLLCS